ncbi:MAG: endonuclease III [Bacteriovoracaceae bacterium]|nr:endonuclease III [Bacteroidota bacterium]
MKKLQNTESGEQKKHRTAAILNLLLKEYPSDQTALQYGNPFQLLVAVILSAQCTDARVNLVTPELFFRFSTPEDFASADIEELESLIYSTGFYHNKAKNIIGCSKALIQNHQGVVPESMEELFQLPGVGRKTANVVLGAAFGKIEGVVVDTHVMRLSNRLKLSAEQDAVKIEKDLMLIVPKKHWFHFSHSLILHGRKICSARRPLCARCLLSRYCPSSQVIDS